MPTRSPPCRPARFRTILLAMPVLVGMLIGFASEARTRSPRPSNAVGFYGAKWSDNFFGELVIFETELRSSYVWVVEASRELAAPYDSLTVEGEVNVGRHTGFQDHLEYNGLLLARWHAFPWDAYLDSTGAFGVGYSYADRRPAVEKAEGDDTERSLAFMALEISFASPDARRWETFVRIHHRSDVYDLVADGRGSNFLGVGVRRHFAWP